MADVHVEIIGDLSAYYDTCFFMLAQSILIGKFSFENNKASDCNLISNQEGK